MCGGGKAPKAPPIPAALPEAPRTPEPAEGQPVADADRRRRLAAGQGASGTILTGARGVESQANVASKTLLGA